ncbi:hypothetical protein AURDEDRAFT_165795 [Auricularia subglabra TFB-10046 SS5]|nr:hypothetical protein AURDEDRAFT_165795 [Auricularia subglabra TFB-10046 SS5]
MPTTSPRRDWLPWTESLRSRVPSHVASLFKVPRAADVLESGFKFYNPRRLVALATTLDSLSIAPAAAHAGWGCLWVAQATFASNFERNRLQAQALRLRPWGHVSRSCWGPRRGPRCFWDAASARSVQAVGVVRSSFMNPCPIARAGGHSARRVSGKPACPHLPRVVHPASIDQVCCLLLPAVSVSHTTRRIFLAPQSPGSGWCREGDLCTLLAPLLKQPRAAGVLVALPVQWRLARSPSFEAGHARRRVPKFR